MTYLFFDTETTGLPKNYRAPYTDLGNWPRIVQLSWILAEEQELLEEKDYIIKVDEPIPVEASRVHGITTERSQSEGRPLALVLDEFIGALASADVLVGHNLSFDSAVLQAELLREGRDPQLNRPGICTMKSTVDFCRLPGNYGFKWPRLEELYQICFQEPLENAHNALIDVRATRKVFMKLRQDHII